MKQDDCENEALFEYCLSENIVSIEFKNNFGSCLQLFPVLSYRGKNAITCRYHLNLMRDNLTLSAA